MARRVFGRRKFHYTALVAVAVVFLAAFGVFVFESKANKSIGSFGDALWWAIVTATTVGYGDVSPVTAEGRHYRSGLDAHGHRHHWYLYRHHCERVFEQDRSELADATARLEAIERKLDMLLSRDQRPMP